jgi:hypothetical protein
MILMESRGGGFAGEGEGGKTEAAHENVHFRFCECSTRLADDLERAVYETYLREF